MRRRLTRLAIPRGVVVDGAEPCALRARTGGMVAEGAASPGVLSVVAMRVGGAEVARPVAATVGERDNMVGRGRAGPAAEVTDAAVTQDDHGDDALPPRAGDAPVPVLRHA
jgi:hypothetical protein